MNARACALTFSLLLALPQAAGAWWLDDSKDAPFVRAVHHLVGIDNVSYQIDLRLVRTIVIAHPEICNQQDTVERGEGFASGNTLLMDAAAADRGARFQHQFRPDIDLAGPAATFRLILRKTGDPALFALNRSSRCALDFACGDIDDMDALYARYRRAHRMPNMNQVLLNWVQSSASPDLRTVRWLMAHGANPRSQDSEGYTIIQRARDTRNQAVVDTLLGQ